MLDAEANAIALAIVRRGGLWLVDRRQTADPHSGLWEFPGGKIRSGETAAQAAVRECAEEVAMVVEPLHQLDAVEHSYGRVRVRLHPILCRPVEGEAHPAERTVAEVRWVDRTTLKRLPMPPANRPLVEALLRLECGESGNSTCDERLPG